LKKVKIPESLPDNTQVFILHSEKPKKQNPRLFLTRNGEMFFQKDDNDEGLMKI